MAVDPQERGKGIGDLLVGALNEDSRRLGAASHTLEVRTGNAAAISLYEKHALWPRACGRDITRITAKMPS